MVPEEKLNINTSELPMIDRLDWTYAATHFDSEETLLKTVKLFTASIEYDAKQLEALYLEIEQEQGRKEYCTKVHSMKSSAAIIGIIPLSGMAKVLEDAARNNECDLIKLMTPIFLKIWREYKVHLKDFSNTESATKNATEYGDQVEEIFHSIQKAAEEIDIDSLDLALAKLEEYQFEGKEAELFEQVREAIINLNLTFLQTLYK